MDYLKRFILLYKDGLKNQSKLGKKLWILVIIKLFIMFVILKVFFFPNFLNSKFSSEKEKSDYIINILTKTTSQNDRD